MAKKARLSASTLHQAEPVAAVLPADDDPEADF